MLMSLFQFRFVSRYIQYIYPVAGSRTGFMKVFRPVTLATCLTQSVTNNSVRVSGNEASESIHGTGDNDVDDDKVNSTLVGCPNAAKSAITNLASYPFALYYNQRMALVRIGALMTITQQRSGPPRPHRRHAERPAARMR